MSEDTSTKPTTQIDSNSLSSSPTATSKRRREPLSNKRVASIDLRIGLHLLGQEGRKLLAEYIFLKRQQ